MNIHELDSYDLGDAVKFNDKLNPRIWGADEKMHPKVREQLLRIADDFREFLGIDVEVKDITVSGSNAAYTYTPHSDIDLHLVVDLPQADESEVYRELFDAKKYAYNDMHNIKIGGYDVELYVQDANKPHHSQGIYSVMNDDWVSVPRRRRPDVDDISVKSKFEDLGHRIEDAVRSQDYEKISALTDKLKDYRQAGLDAHGEFGPENLAFKILRTQGLIKKLYDARNEAKDKLLSLDERRKKKKKVRYGYSGYWYPGTAYAGQDHPAGTEGGGGDGGGESVREDATLTWDGVNPSTAMFTTETENKTDEEILRDFIKFCVSELKIADMPRVKLRRDPQWPKIHKTFGRYQDDAKTLEVAWGNRHIMDVLRTVAHELTHKRQHEREDMPASAGETGSEYENEANARAGILMRDWAKLHPEHFDVGQATDLSEDEMLEEALKDRAAAAAVMTCLIAGGTLSGCATNPAGTTQQMIKTTQDAGRVAQTASKITRAGTEAEVNQELRNLSRAAGGGDPGAANASNIIRLWRMLKAKPQPPYTDDEPPVNAPAPPVKRMPQYEGASGYIPTRAQAKDPRYSMALTVDIRPGQVGKEANKLKLKTDRQGHPQVARANGLFEQLMAEYQQVKEGIEAPVSKTTDEQQYLKFILAKVNSGRVLNRHEQRWLQDYQLKKKLAENEDLDEVKMSPSALEKFAASDAAKGIRAGFEAELIFRDTQGEADELDPEPDYDADERAYSIQQVIEFFDNDDYGYGLSDRQRNRLEENLDEKYMEWRDEQIISDFRNDAEDLIRDILLEETPMDQRIHFYLTDSLQMSDEEADAVIKAGAEAPKFTNSDAQKDYADENPEYKAYLEAADEAEQELEESVEFSVNRQDEYWDEALDNYRDNYTGDDDSFFSDVGLRWMSDIANEFNLDWPVWNMDARGNDGSRSWEEIGNSLQDAVDMPVKVSSGYHSTTRRPGQWIIEPDSSLDPDDKGDEAGLEIVSPPMPLLTAIEKLRAVTDWANDPNGGNAYTNSSTGLHMGVSLPTMKSEAVPDDTGIDYVKLILFLGDKYVLQQFGREANTYTASALDKLKQNIKGKKSDPAGVVELLRHGLTELAQRELQKGVGTSKYTSAHIQPGYIEFRSPGGDWLAKADEEIGVLENTMMRFARAMAIAGDPSAERQEYAKKLYKLVTADNEQYADQLRLFSEFSAGTINKEQLKKQWAQATLAKDAPELSQKDQWQLIDRQTRKAVPGGFEYDNFTQDEARERARQRLDLDDQQFDQKYEIVPYNSGKWEIYAYDPDFDTEPQQLEIVDAPNRGSAVDAVYDKYNAERIPFKVRPYYGAVEAKPEPKLTPRAKLAQRIVKTPKAPLDYNYDIIDQRTLDLKAIDRFYAANDQEASRVFDQWLKMKNLPNDTANYGYRRSAALGKSEQQAQDPSGVPVWEIYERETGHVVHTFANLEHSSAWTQAQQWLRDIGAEQPNLFSLRAKTVPNAQAADARRDSADLQRNLGVRDVETDVAQNFEPQRGNWEVYQSDEPDRVVNTFIDVTERQVQDWLQRQETRGMPPGFLSARRQSTTESIDPVSGAGAVSPRSTIKKMDTAKKIQPVEPVIRPQAYRSAIGQAISQQDLENMTRQIQTARKLGDDVNENFADKKVSGKSRPGRVKKAGASCKGSVTDLRARAKKYGGEKGKMYHWCANMKSGRSKNK